MVGYGRMWEGDPMVNLWATVRRLALPVVVSQELNGSLAAGFPQLECVSTFEGPHVHRYTRPVVLGNHRYIATRRCPMAQWHFSAQNNKNHSDTVQRKYTRIIQHYMMNRLLSQPHSASAQLRATAKFIPKTRFSAFLWPDLVSQSWA